MDKERDIKAIKEILEQRVGTNLGQIQGTKSGYGKCADITTTVDTILVAQAIVEAGYGDTKQAVREFAEGLEEIKRCVRDLNVCFDDEWRYLLEDTLDKIDELLAEVTGK